MKAQEIRDRFINYFVSKGHHHVTSSSLVPHNDPTLLFANAGMNQFKNYFTGIEKPPFTRAVSIQKCVRAGGKHNDLENVGCTARHHTFFEMLGNFSFGDYFKRDAIEYAWDFLTKVLSIPSSKLYVTVHNSDDEAYELWNNIVPSTHILRKGDKDNFWSMGDTGPCGPCSEIFYDHGPNNATPNFSPKKGQDILDDENRYVEIWNLVFMQFEQTEGGRKSLPNPSIDTGAGLERIAAALQNVYWNYDTDLFAKLITEIEQLTKSNYSDSNQSTSIRVIADHVRSCSLLISDGVLPSNEGKGYVLRRIIRRATRHLRKLNAPNSCLAKLSHILFDEIKEQYPENYSNRQLAFEMLESEERKFLETLDNGLKYLQNNIKENTSANVFSGKAAFKLYDTFGFPLDLTQSILREQGIEIDIDEFNVEMEKRKSDSRNSWKGRINFDEIVFYDLREKYGITKFTGHVETSSVSNLITSMKLDDHRHGFIFDSTPFYGESGGQVGDIGTIIYQDRQYEIIDTIKPIDNFIIHVTESAIDIPPKAKCRLIVSSKERSLTERNHTATHLLHKVLANMLGDHVKQAGSFVSPDKLRFDYTHMKSPSGEQIDQIEQAVNKLIDENLSVSTTQSTYDDALKSGATALFGEKYGEEVRVVNIADKSIELCGGTHTKNTSEITCFKIVSEGALSTGIRRIEALTSTTAFDYLSQRSKHLSQIETLLKDRVKNLPGKIEKMYSDIRKKNKEISKLQGQLNSKSSSDLFANPESLPNDYCFKAVQVPQDSDMRNLSDIFLDKFPNGFLFLYSDAKPQASILLRGPRRNKSFNLNMIIKQISPLGNIRGGGRPDMIQGKADTKSIEDIIITVINLISSI